MLTGESWTLNLDELMFLITCDRSVHVVMCSRLLAEVENVPTDRDTPQGHITISKQ